MNGYLKNSIAVIFFAALVFPGLNTSVFLLDDAPALNGAYTHISRPVFDSLGWYSGEYQKQYELFFNDSLGIKNFLVRLRNQVDYSVFGKTNSSDIVIGKNGYLAATTHFDYHLGKSVTNHADIDITIEQIQFLQDTLQKKGITLCLLFAPSRGHYFLELAPSWYDTTKKAESDYDYYVRKCNEHKINYIDFDKYFMQLKPKYGNKLFTKCGIHWSWFGAVLAEDTLIRYMEKTSKIDLPDISIRNINKTQIVQGGDADIGDLLNLFYPIDNDTMYYPELEIDSLNKKKPDVLVIADSFQWTVENTSIPRNIYNNYSFWYYYNTFYTKTTKRDKRFELDELKREIEKNQFIFVMATKNNIGSLGWSFFGDACAVYQNEADTLVSKYIKGIRSNDEWLNNIKAKALQSNIPIEKMIRLDAEYMAKEEREKIKNKQ